MWCGHNPNVCTWLHLNPPLPGRLIYSVNKQRGRRDANAFDDRGAQRARLQVVMQIVLIMDSLCWGTAITSWGVDKAIHAMHPAVAVSPWAAIIAGILSGSGGGILAQVIAPRSVWRHADVRYIQTFNLKEQAWSFQAPDTLVNPTLAMKVKCGRHTHTKLTQCAGCIVGVTVLLPQHEST